MLTVREVKTTRDIKEFIELPLKLYENCSYFVPPLYSDEKKLLLSGGNTENAESVFFLAVDNGKTVGRVHGIIEKQYNKNHNTRKARFTRFDCIDCDDVATALFEALEKWAERKGMSEICGPLGFNDLNREGLLVEGFFENSTFEEQYNYEYYGRLLENIGFRKDVDWVEYELRFPEKRNEMMKRVAERALEINHLHVASTDISKRKYIAKYRDSFFECLDICYRHLYGTVDLTKEVQDELVSQFNLIVNKKYVIFICDENERVVAFGVCFPSIGDAIKKSGGRLTPAALLKLLRIVKRPRVIDLGLVAVLPEYQNSGINAVMINRMLDMLEKDGIEKYETNLNLETNDAVRAQWKYFNARQHKRRRSYIKKIGE